MFEIDSDALVFITKHVQAVTIALNFQPAIGGCACSKNSITGSYIPGIALGQPQAGEEQRFHQIECQGVQVFYPAKLQIKEGFSHIRITRKNVLWWSWLELQGAKAIPMIDKGG